MIARDYQFLCGKPINADYSIEQVMIVPYSRILQWRHISAHMAGQLDIARLLVNPADRYDVVVVSSCNAVESGFICKDIRTYLQETGAFFNHTRYSCWGFSGKEKSMPVSGSEISIHTIGKAGIEDLDAGV